MCGIAGCIGIRDKGIINRMLDALPHRGPDDRGIHINGNGVFGHTRLSIVDVARGHQPSKYPFKTQSDTEVILNLYRDKGPECVKELDGMFAFAIFDGEDFLMARDPIGIKPLYYGYHKDNLNFTSELGAMSLAGVGEVHEYPAGHYGTSWMV